MYAGHTQFCKVVFSPGNCHTLAKAEAAVLRFSYTVILLLVVPIVIVMLLDVLFYAKELFSKAEFFSMDDSVANAKSYSVPSIDLALLLRDRVFVSSERWAFSKTETLHRLKTIIDIAAFVFLVTNPLKPSDLLTPSKPKPLTGRKGRTSAKPVPPDDRNRDLSDNIDLAHSNVCPLCGMMQSSQVQAQPSVSKVSSNSSLSSSANIGEEVVSLLKSSATTDFWNVFCALWSNLLRKSLRALNTSSVVHMIEHQKANLSFWLSLHGLGQNSILSAKSNIFSRASMLLSGKRRWLRMMEHSQ